MSQWPEAKVFRYVADGDWRSIGRLGNELESMPLLVYNGKLYGGTLPLAEVYRLDGDASWTNVGRLDHTPDVKYRRAWSMAVFQGRLFCGTLPSGHVHSIEAGKNVTNDRELAPGWRHVAAVRRGNRLELFIDGDMAARSEEFLATDYDLTVNCRPALENRMWCSRLLSRTAGQHPSVPRCIEPDCDPRSIRKRKAIGMMRPCP